MNEKISYVKIWETVLKADGTASTKAWTKPDLYVRNNEKVEANK